MCEELLRQSSLFTGLSPNELQNFAGKLTAREYPPDKVIINEGDPGDTLLIICQGEIEIIKAIDTPEEHQLNIIREGNYLGEMSLLGLDQTRTASARTRGFVQALEMRRADFESLLLDHPGIALKIMEDILRRIRKSDDVVINELKGKNQQLQLAYQELKEAQKKLIQKEKLDHELSMARQIQERLLPSEMPSPPGWRIESLWQPAQVVSGDFFDFIPLSEDTIAVVIGDVSGKGLPASLLMATTRSMLRGLSSCVPDKNYLSPGMILEEANKLLVEDTPAAMSVTCIFAAVNLASGQVRLANAGHCYPYHRTSGDPEGVLAKGMPLGFFPGMTYEEIELSLSPGDSLLFYSDGLIEARNADNQLYGNDRLFDLLKDKKNDPKLFDQLVINLGEFAGPGWEKEDDLTMVLLKRLRLNKSH